MDFALLLFSGADRTPNGGRVSAAGLLLVWTESL